MKIANSALDLVGHTPLVKLNKVITNKKVRVLAKLEYYNPTSSVKDRIALNMIVDAEQKGLLNSNSTIIEPTSGNTGIGLAFVAAVKGYKIILVMPDSMSEERRKLMKILGARFELTPGKLGMKGAIAKAEELIANNSNYFMPQQFDNLANPQIHRVTTANEIWEDTDGQVDILVSGVGTGGTITGIASELKKRKSSFKAIAVEPEASPILSGGKPGPHKIQGIGAGFIPSIVDISLIDEVVLVSNENAGIMARRTALEEGLVVGISSGAAIWASNKIAQKPENEGKTIVTIIPSSGERYLSTWLFDN